MSTARKNRRHSTVRREVTHACGHAWPWLFDYDTATEIDRRAAAKAADDCFDCRLRAEGAA